ncbi:hypothetical protein M5D96_007281 [Drosophila gunungcola]|uniref:Uncharacterized protein n=1 Tax=Drosophila gunungcola TaxID=103775 RepID=A0A9P9YMX5_9MUSC|nr:hypothetical protein M5D96_007281 [Drosophila gunungcola]
MATSEQSRRPLEPIFIATPPHTPLLHHHSSITRTTTPREMPTMYHFDFGKPLQRTLRTYSYRFMSLSIDSLHLK